MGTSRPATFALPFFASALFRAIGVAMIGCAFLIRRGGRAGVPVEPAA